MPSKSHRAASRQARLSRRKRRGKPALQNFQAGPSQPTAVADPDDDPRPASQPSASAVATQSRAAAPSPARAVARSRRRAAASENATRYLGRELRQIGFITTFIALILAALTFVLG